MGQMEKHREEKHRTGEFSEEDTHKASRGEFTTAVQSGSELGKTIPKNVSNMVHNPQQIVSRDFPLEYISVNKAVENRFPNERRAVSRIVTTNYFSTSRKDNDEVLVQNIQKCLTASVRETSVLSFSGHRSGAIQTVASSAAQASLTLPPAAQGTLPPSAQGIVPTAAQRTVPPSGQGSRTIDVGNTDIPAALKRHWEVAKETTGAATRESWIVAARDIAVSAAQESQAVSNTAVPAAQRNSSVAAKETAVLSTQKRRSVAARDTVTTAAQLSHSVTARETVVLAAQSYDTMDKKDFTKLTDHRSLAVAYRDSNVPTADRHSTTSIRDTTVKTCTNKDPQSSIECSRRVPTNRAKMTRHSSRGSMITERVGAPGKQVDVEEVVSDRIVEPEELLYNFQSVPCLRDIFEPSKLPLSMKHTSSPTLMTLKFNTLQSDKSKNEYYFQFYFIVSIPFT